MLKKMKKILAGLFILFIVSLISSQIWIYKSTKQSIYNNISELPYNKVGLIPGCNKYVSNGIINYYYTQRINTGVQLYKMGKIDYILVSGDNAHASYDEPREMKKSLIEAGIPKNRIYSDYAGFRTLDTIIRAKEVFRLDQVTFISQNFHNQRGVFIGKNREIDVIAFNAGSGSIRYGLKTRVREIFAKFKMLLDLYILDKGPKFLGEEITIGENQDS